MVQEGQSEKNAPLLGLLDALEMRLETPKTELVVEIEAQLTKLLGLEVKEAFRAVAARQQHNAPSMNLDRVHKSALVIIAHVLTEAVSRAEDEWRGERTAV